MGQIFFLAESQSRLYPHMRAKFGRDPTAVSKKVPFNFINTKLRAAFGLLSKLPISLQRVNSAPPLFAAACNHRSPHSSCPSIHLPWLLSTGDDHDENWASPCTDDVTR